jgi:hypothetical protein
MVKEDYWGFWIEDVDVRSGILDCRFEIEEGIGHRVRRQESESKMQI